jgi:GDP-L-fucose synthase
VSTFFSAEKPDFVILAAAKVEGIQANWTYPAEFIYENLMIQSNVIHQPNIQWFQKTSILGKY